MSLSSTPQSVHEFEAGRRAQMIRATASADAQTEPNWAVLRVDGLVGPERGGQRDKGQLYRLLAALGMAVRLNFYYHYRDPLAKCLPPRERFPSIRSTSRSTRARAKRRAYGGRSSHDPSSGTGRQRLPQMV